MAPTSAPARLDLQLCSIPTLLTDTNLKQDGHEVNEAAEGAAEGLQYLGGWSEI